MLIIESLVGLNSTRECLTECYVIFPILIDIQWPEEGLSWEAHDLINKLLSRDPAHRPSPAQLKAHPFFRGVDWENIRNQEAPFIPCPNDNMDTSYFDGTY